MKSLTILISLLLIPTITLAVDSSGNYAIWGVGTKACIGFNQDTAANDIERYKDFMKGFMTAYNIFTEKTYSISGKMNSDQIIEWLNEYCDDNPMSTLENALTSFTFDHYDKRMKISGSSGGR